MSTSSIFSVDRMPKANAKSLRPRRQRRTPQRYGGVDNRDPVVANDPQDGGVPAAETGTQTAPIAAPVTTNGPQGTGPPTATPGITPTSVTGGSPLPQAQPAGPGALQYQPGAQPFGAMPLPTGHPAQVPNLQPPNSSQQPGPFIPQAPWGWQPTWAPPPPPPGFPAMPAYNPQWPHPGFNMTWPTVQQAPVGSTMAQGTTGESAPVFLGVQPGNAQYPHVSIGGLAHPVAPTIAAVAAAGVGPTDLLDEEVPAKVRAMVVSGEYFELTKLDKDAYNELAYNIKVGGSDEDVSLQLAKKKDPKSKVLTFDQWSDLFFKYMYIYMSRLSPEAAQILPHYRTVQAIQREGGDWQAYDKAFRKRRARLQFSWDSVCQLSYSKAFHKPQTQVTQQSKNGAKTSHSFRNTNNKSVPPGYCFRFHISNDGCYFNPCKWKHQCYHCQSNHKASTCTSSRKTSTYTQQSSSRPNKPGFSSKT